ncbi:hypothetical protein [Saccharothrix stipae]
MPAPTSGPTPGNDPRHDDRRDGGTDPLLSLRTAVILLPAVLCGVGTVLLLTWAGQHPGLTIPSGVIGAAGATAFFDRVIGR